MGETTGNDQDQEVVKDALPDAGLTEEDALIADEATFILKREAPALCKLIADNFHVFDRTQWANFIRRVRDLKPKG